MNSNIDYLKIFEDFIADEKQQYAYFNTELQRDNAIIVKIYNYIFPIILSEYKLSASNAYAEMSVADIDIYLKYKYTIIIKFNRYCEKNLIDCRLEPKSAILY